MKNVMKIATALFAVLISLSACMEDKGTMLNEDEAASARNDMGLGQTGMKVFRNNYIAFAYPEDLSISQKTEVEGFMKAVSFSTGHQFVTIECVSYAVEEDVYIDVPPYQENIVKGYAIIDGREVACRKQESDDYTFTDYVYQNGKQTIAIKIMREKDVQEDFDVTEHLKWVMPDMGDVEWMAEMEMFIAKINDGYQKEGFTHSYYKLIPEEATFIIHLENSTIGDDREKIRKRLSLLCKGVVFLKRCMEAGYTFLFEQVDGNGDAISSYSFVSDELNVKEND